MTDAEPEPLLVFDNTCLSAFASAHLMPVLKDLTLDYRVGATEAVRDEFCAGPNNVADIAWVDLLPEQGMNELLAGRSLPLRWRRTVLVGTQPQPPGLTGPLR